MQLSVQTNDVMNVVSEQRSNGNTYIIGDFWSKTKPNWDELFSLCSSRFSFVSPSVPLGGGLHSTRNLLSSFVSTCAIEMWRPINAQLTYELAFRTMAPFARRPCKGNKCKIERKWKVSLEKWRPTLSNRLSAPVVCKFDVRASNLSENEEPWRNKRGEYERNCNNKKTIQTMTGIFPCKVLLKNKKKNECIKMTVNQEANVKMLQVLFFSFSFGLFFLSFCLCFPPEGLRYFFFSWKKIKLLLPGLMTFCGLTCQMFEAPYQVILGKGKWAPLSLSLDNSVLFQRPTFPRHAHRNILEKCQPSFVLFIDMLYMNVYLYIHPSPYI